MHITRAAHEEALAELVSRLDAEGIAPEHGIHGPECIAWRISAESANFMGAGAAVLMQLAHPYVAQGIADHSMTMSSVRKRFVGTFENIYKMTFGTRESALASARALHVVHSRVVGQLSEAAGCYPAGHRYQANELQALRWVYATLAWGAMRVHTVAGLRLTPDECSEFYRESANFAALFGLRSAHLPPSYEAFLAYVEDEVRSPRITVTAPAREIAAHLLTAPVRRLRPLFVVYRAVTAHLLPPALREPFSLSYGAKEATLAKLAIGAANPLRSLSPDVLRLMPDALRAEHRLGMRRESRVAPLLESAVLKSLDAWQ